MRFDLIPIIKELSDLNCIKNEMAFVGFLDIGQLSKIGRDVIKFI